MKSPRFIQVYREDQAAIRLELLRGLRQPVAQVAPKHLYDPLGSRLFEAITELPEYYPTRTEAHIFRLHGQAMADAAPAQATLIDLGAGNCNKAASLFDHFRPSRYVAVDISVAFVRNALECLQRQYPALEMVGAGIDFSAGLDLPAELELDRSASRIFFYPGSSIGNFTPEEALTFLRSVHAACEGVAGSGLLIGVDLVKDLTELEAAYNDALGVTAAFNRNLLRHINHLAGTDFALADWQHLARYDVQRSRIEMHLQAVRSVTLCWQDGASPQRRHFAAGETIHTENSYKWRVPRFAQLLTDAGFAAPRHWCDPAQRFAVFWAAVS